MVMTLMTIAEQMIEMNVVYVVVMVQDTGMQIEMVMDLETIKQQH